VTNPYLRVVFADQADKLFLLEWIVRNFIVEIPDGLCLAPTDDELAMACNDSGRRFTNIGQLYGGFIERHSVPKLILVSPFNYW
jgi:hypothetical protein